MARLFRLANEFLAQEAAGGIVMLICAALALCFANSGLGDRYHALIALPLNFTAGPLAVATTPGLFVKDVLMSVFFLTVGMELKREMAQGFLAAAGQKILPLAAALGGIAMPALIYLAANHAIPAHRSGWAVPTATDIAFALCVLNLLGKRVPGAAKIFLLAIAIYDDLAAIVIIALFYSHGVTLDPLLIGAALATLMVALNRRARTPLALYLLLGALLWHFVHAAGIHPTVAGMITGLAIPLRGTNPSDAPLDRLLHTLHPWVAFGVLPLFAFVSAGVDLSGLAPADLLAPLPLGIALGLFLGKPLGIVGGTLAAVKLGLAELPRGLSRPVLYGVATIAGIGFTMSLFIGLLAFPEPAQYDAARLGVMTGSLLSACWGLRMLRRALR